MARPAKADRPPAAKRAAARWLLLLSAVGFGLAVAEVATRLFAAVIGRPAIVVSDAAAGWSLAPNLREVMVAGNGGSYRLSTDSQGRRVAYAQEEVVADATPRVVVLGDSFANGVIVEDDETFAWRLARRFPQYHVVNLGVLGYGTTQEVVRLEQFVAANPRATIGEIVVLIIENDFRDSQRLYDPFLGRSTPVFEVTERGLERVPYRPSFLDRLMDQSRLVWLANSKLALWLAPAPLPTPGPQVVEAGLAAARAVARATGARLHLFAYRRPIGSEVDDEFWNQFLTRTGAVEITDAFRGDAGLIGYDRGHWNAAGHARAADLFAKALESP